MMDQNMRSKIIVIGILLVLGIGMSFICVTFATSVFGETKHTKEVWMMDRQRVVVPNASDNLSEGVGIPIEKEGSIFYLIRGGEKVGFLDVTEIKIATINLTDCERWLSKEIALNDSEVKKLIDGKDYCTGNF